MRASQMALGHAIRLVGFLFDDGGVELAVDAMLDRRALVVADIDRAGKLDERSIEALLRLMLADAIFDIPELRIHLLQFRLVGGDRRIVWQGASPGVLQQG